MTTLAIKEWFCSKNNIQEFEVDTILEVREKAVKVTTTSYGRTFVYWIPKTCLELLDVIDDSRKTDLTGMTIEEAINVKLTSLTLKEIADLNRSEFNSYR